jgi:hypothetical protein
VFQVKGKAEIQKFSIKNIPQAGLIILAIGLISFPFQTGLVTY